MSTATRPNLRCRCLSRVPTSSWMGSTCDGTTPTASGASMQKAITRSRVLGGVLFWVLEGIESFSTLLGNTNRSFAKLEKSGGHHESGAPDRICWQPQQLVVLFSKGTLFVAVFLGWVPKQRHTHTHTPLFLFSRLLPGESAAMVRQRWKNLMHPDQWIVYDHDECLWKAELPRKTYRFVWDNAQKAWDCRFLFLKLNTLQVLGFLLCSL